MVLTHSGLDSWRSRLLIGLLCSTQAVDIVSLSSVNVALPAIDADLGFGQAMLPWVVSAYALTFAGFLLVGGRLADLLGRRRILLAGFVLFGAAALACALSTGPAMLVAARAIQGIGAALTIPASLAILSSAFPEPSERSRALAAFAAAGAVGFAAGLVLGGLVTDRLGWRWVFGLNVPVVVALFALVPAVVSPDPLERGAGRVDLAGAASGTLGLLLLAFGLTHAAEGPGSGDPVTLVALLGAVLVLAAFVLLQARVRDPLMPLRIWRVPNFAPVMVVALCLYAGWTGVTYHVAITLQRVLGYDPAEASFAMLPYAVGGYIASSAAGRLLPRVGAKALLLSGLAFYGAGIALTGTIAVGTGYWPRIFLALSVTVVGLGLTFVAANVAALADADPAEHGLVGGLFNTGLQVGGGIGLAVLTAVAASFTPSGATGAALLPGYRAAFFAAAGITVFAFLVALLWVRAQPRQAPGTARRRTNTEPRLG